MLSKKQMDYTLFIVVLLLVSIGILMVYSSSFYYAMDKWDNKAYFFQKELLWSLIGLVGMLVASQVNYRIYGKFAWLLLGGSLVLLFYVLATGEVIGGAQRWIKIGKITIMPGEIAKFAVVVFMAQSLSKNQHKLKKLTEGVLPYLVLIGIFFTLILKQPNFSTALTVAGVMFVMLFIAGLPWLYVTMLGIGGFGAAVYFMVSAPYRMKRFTTFLDPFADPTSNGWQVVQSLYALGSGGLFGVGIGKSTQNKLYLPEPQNDFIFATIGEEFGFLGSVLIIVLFIILIWRGIKIAVNAQDRYGCYLASGITATIAIQAMINIAVTTSSVPTTGIPLPFISFGGNSLALLMGQIGILLNISRFTTDQETSDNANHTNRRRNSRAY